MGAGNERGEGTRAVHAGLPGPSAGTPFLPGPVFAAPYHLPGEPDATPYGYGRYANPTWTAYESAIGELEGGHALVFASGMAACTAVLVPLLSAGDVLVASADGYPTIRALATEHLEPRGVEVRFVPTRELAGAAAGASLVWLETPSNPALDVADIATVAEAASAPLVVDNTLATPLGQRPLARGAAISVTSASKALTGHGDLVMGLVTCADEGLASEIRRWRDRSGAIAGPMEAWLAHRSLATLDLRLERQCATALALAELLAARDDVEGVRYPGLPSDPSHAVAAAQMRRFGPVVAFDLGAREPAERFLSRLELVAGATSFGGVHSSAERRARWGHGDAVGEGFIRFSCGIEDTADVLADVTRALA